MTATSAERLRVAGLVLAAVAAWAATHTYYGVFHDGILYAMQAVVRWSGGPLAEDLFLRHGSQDDYTVFPILHGALIAALGLAAATKILVAAAHALWLAALALLARRLAATPALAILLVVVVAAGDARYGASGFLKFGEGVATPRVFAEALCLFALGLVLGGRVVVAVALLLAALATHPLVGLSGGAVVFLVAALRDRRLWALPPIGFAGAALAAGLDIGPAGLLFQRFDAEWLEAVRLRASYLFIDGYKLADACRMTGEAAALFVAARRAPGALATAFRAALLAMAIGLAATVVGVDLLENVLITQLQPWRMIWMTKVIALLAIGVLVAGDWGSPRERVLAFLLLFAVVTSGVSNLADIAQGVLGGALALVHLTGDRFRPIAAFALIAGALAAAANGLSIVETVGGLARFYERLGEGAGFVDWRFGLIRPGAVLLALVIFAAPRMIFAAPAIAAAAALAVTSLSVWDRRDDWRRYVENTAGRLPLPHSFESPAASVYWRGADMLPSVWFGLGRPSFVSRTQGAGSVFNRETAMAYQKREALVQAFDEDANANVARHRGKAAANPTLEDLAAICAHDEAPELIVLRAPVEGVETTIWRSPKPVVSVYLDPDTGQGLDGFQARRTRDHALHACEAVRAAAIR